MDTGHVLDESDCAFDGLERVAVESEGQCEEEQHLRVGRALDVRVERRVHGQNEVPLQLGEPADQAVVHPEPPAMAERMAVGALDRRSGRGPHVREQ